MKTLSVRILRLKFYLIYWVNTLTDWHEIWLDTCTKIYSDSNDNLHRLTWDLRLTSIHLRFDLWPVGLTWDSIIVDQRFDLRLALTLLTFKTFRHSADGLLTCEDWPDFWLRTWFKTCVQINLRPDLKQYFHSVCKPELRVAAVPFWRERRPRVTCRGRVGIKSSSVSMQINVAVQYVSHFWTRHGFSHTLLRG